MALISHEVLSCELTWVLGLGEGKAASLLNTPRLDVMPVLGGWCCPGPFQNADALGRDKISTLNQRGAVSPLQVPEG
jgi:hypothetical protein